MLAIGVASLAIGGIGEIGAAGDRVRVGGSGRPDSEQQNKGGERRPYCLISARYLPWQPPQPFLPMSAKAS